MGSKRSLGWNLNDDGCTSETHLELNQLGAINVESIGKNADGHSRSRKVRKPERRARSQGGNGKKRETSKLT